MRANSRSARSGQSAPARPRRSRASPTGTAWRAVEAWPMARPISAPPMVPMTPWTDEAVPAIGAICSHRQRAEVGGGEGEGRPSSAPAATMNSHRRLQPGRARSAHGPAVTSDEAERADMADAAQPEAADDARIAPATPAPSARRSRRTPARSARRRRTRRRRSAGSRRCRRSAPPKIAVSASV